MFEIGDVVRIRDCMAGALGVVQRRISDHGWLWVVVETSTSTEYVFIKSLNTGWESWFYKAHLEKADV